MPKPYFDDGQCVIYHGDCREILPEIGPIDLTITDPPYGIGLDYGRFVDSQDNVAALVRVVVPLVIAKSKRVLLTCGTRQQWMYPPPTWVLCWLNRAGSYPNPWGFTCWQPILAYGPDPFLERRLGFRADVIEHSESTEKNGHPCPKPLIFWSKLLLRGSVSTDDTILDPFMGSGTTLRAAKDNNRHAIGIEIEERYCEIAAKRLSQQVLSFG